MLLTGGREIIMIKNMNAYKLPILSLALAGLFVVPAFAISENAGGTNSSGAQSAGSSVQTAQAGQSSDQSKGVGKLEDNKKKICQKNENRITNMFTNMNKLGQGQLNLFDNIAERVRTYYAENNMSIDNYDQLVQNIEQTRTLAQNSIKTTTQTSSQFGCEKDDPKGVASQYKLQVKTQVKELQDHRAAIKDLIQAIQASSGETQ